MILTESPNHVWTGRWTPLRLRYEQLRLWREGARFKVVAAGRRSGKTELAKRKVVEQAVDSAGRGIADRYLVGAPTVEQVKAIFWDDLKALLDPTWIIGVSESELCITLVGGVKICLHGLDKPQRIEGVRWKGAIVDEIADCQAGTWFNHLQAALAGNDGWAWIIGTPDREGPGQRDFQQLISIAQTMPAERWGFYSWSSSDVLGAEEIDELRATMSHEAFEQEINAKFVAGAGAAFGDFSSAVHVGRKAYEEGRNLCWGLDFNINPMCSGVFQTRDGEINVLEEIELAHTDTHQACEHLIELARRRRWDLGNLQIYGDATGNARDSTSGISDWEIVKSELAEYRPRICVPRRNPYQKESINAVRAMMRSAENRVRLNINPECKKLIWEIQDARWPGELDGYHHLAWLRYAAAWIIPVRQKERRGGFVGFSRGD